MTTKSPKEIKRRILEEYTEALFDSCSISEELIEDWVAGLKSELDTYAKAVLEHCLGEDEIVPEALRSNAHYAEMVRGFNKCGEEARSRAAKLLK